MRQRTFWIAFGLGAVVGGVAAILCAPQSGAMTRRKLRRSVEDLSDNLQDAGDYLKEQAERLSKEARSSSTPAKSQLGERGRHRHRLCEDCQQGVQSATSKMM